MMIETTTGNMNKNCKQIQKNLTDVDGEDGFARYQLDSTTITTHIRKVTMMIGMKKIQELGKNTMSSNNNIYSDDD